METNLGTNLGTDMDTSLLGHRIQEARQNAGLDQAEFAERIGVKPSTVEEWESDTLAPRANRIQMMSSILNVPMTWLLAGGEITPESEVDVDLYQMIDDKIRVLELKVDEINTLVAELRILSDDAAAMRYKNS